MIAAGKVHIDRPLSNFAQAFMPQGAIADSVLPIVPVQKQSDLYTIFDQADWFRREYSERAPGTEARAVRMRISSAAFYCRNYELNTHVTREEMANSDPLVMMKLEQSKIALPRVKLDIEREVRMATLMHASCGSRVAVASVWNDPVNSDPVADITTAIHNVQFATGYRPNKMVVSWAVWEQLRKHNAIINKGVNPYVTGGKVGFVTQQAVASIFDLDEVLVGALFQNTTEEGSPQAMALSPVWSNACIVYHAPAGASTDIPTFGAQFFWDGGMGTDRFYVQRHQYDTLKGSQKFGVGYYADERAVGSSLGFALTGAVT